MAQASPGATIEDVRDYHHVFEGFAIKVPAATMAAIKGVQGVKGAFFEGRHEPVTDPDFWDMRDHSTDSSPDLGTASRMTGAAAASQRSSTSESTPRTRLSPAPSMLLRRASRTRPWPP